MNRDTLGVFTLMFGIPALLLALFLYFAFFTGNSRAAMLEETLIQQYGKRKGRLVAVLLLLLFLLGAWGLWYLRRGWVYDVARGLE